MLSSVYSSKLKELKVLVRDCGADPHMRFRFFFVDIKTELWFWASVTMRQGECANESG